MDSRQININGKLCSVATLEEFLQHPELYNNYFTAVDVTVHDKRMILPVRSPLDNKPGLYIRGIMAEAVVPPEEDEQQYSADNVVDFTDVTSMSELLDKQAQVRDIERDILTSPDDITVPNISSLDSPEMRGLKEAIREKRIDINKYEDRFGTNFANDKRLLKQHTITNKMLKRLLTALDMKATLVIEDANPDVPNPIGKKIRIDMIGYSDDESTSTGG